FVSNKNEWLLQGQASCTVQGSQVLVILPNNSHLTSEPKDCETDFSALGCKALKVRGRQDIIIEGDETYRIKTGREKIIQAGFSFQGKRLNWASYPDELYLGVPRIIQKSDNIS